MASKLWDSVSTERLKTLPNPSLQSNHEITAREFTILGAKSQPDFGEICINYSGSTRALELKSFKEYLYQYRDTIMSYERCIEIMFAHLNAVLENPVHLTITIEFLPRGGISSKLTRTNTYERLQS